VSVTQGSPGVCPDRAGGRCQPDCGGEGATMVILHLQVVGWGWMGEDGGGWGAGHAIRAAAMSRQVPFPKGSKGVPDPFCRAPGR